MNGTLKLTLVQATDLISRGTKEPTTKVRLRVLNADPKDPNLKPKVSQAQSSNVTPKTTNTKNPEFNQSFQFEVRDTRY